MPEAFLDSSVLIGLVFRHAGERAACRASIPAGSGDVVCSRYVIFEVARGFLRSLIALHNYSFEFTSFSDLHRAAHSGQQRFKPYAMHTWLGAFDDYFAALENEDGLTSEPVKLEELRAKLRGWIRRGWGQVQNGFTIVNPIGCRDDLQPPAVRADERIDQTLPDAECGRPTACRLQAFLGNERADANLLETALTSISNSQMDRETAERISALTHLLESLPAKPFDGKKCHRCGDGLICLEARPDQTIVTKNRKHFEPMAGALAKPLAIAETARSTRK